MPLLLFEIWDDPDNNNFEMSPVTERSDELRKQIAPNARLIHSFHASSDFEAYQLNYDFHGWGTWKRLDFLDEHFFSEGEALEQSRYLAKRSTS